MDNYHNDYNHSFDAINIANGNPQYIGSGVLMLILHIFLVIKILVVVRQ